MTLSVEEKGLNSHRLISEKLQIQVPHISELPRPTMDEFASAMDELTTVMEGALQLEPERQNVPLTTRMLSLDILPPFLRGGSLKLKR